MAKDRVHRAADLFALLLNANQARQDQDLLVQEWRGEYLEQCMSLPLPPTDKETFVLLILS